MRLRRPIAIASILVAAIVFAPTGHVAATSSPISPETVQIEVSGSLYKGITDAQFGPDGTLYVARMDTEPDPDSVDLAAFARTGSSVAYVSSPVVVALPSSVTATRGLAINADGTKLALVYANGPARSDDGGYNTGVLVYDLPLTNTSQPSRVITDVNTATTLAWDRIGNLWVNGWSPDGWWWSVLVYGPTATGAATPLRQMDIENWVEPMAVLVGPDNRLTLPMRSNPAQLWSYAYDPTLPLVQQQSVPDVVINPPSASSEYWTNDALGRLYFAKSTDPDPSVAAAPWEVRTYAAPLTTGATPVTTTIDRGVEVNGAVWNGYYTTGGRGPYLRIDPSDGSLVIITLVRSSDASGNVSYYYMDRYATSTDAGSTNAVIKPTATMPPLPEPIGGAEPSPEPSDPAPTAPAGPTAPGAPGPSSPAPVATPLPNAEAPVDTAVTESPSTSAGPIIPGIEVLGQVGARGVAARPGITAAASPRVRVERGRPVALRLSGMPAGTSFIVQVNRNGSIGSLGTVVVAEDGSLSLPPLRLTQRGTTMIVMTDPATGVQRFVRLVVPPTRSKR